MCLVATLQATNTPFPQTAGTVKSTKLMFQETNCFCIL